MKCISCVFALVLFAFTSSAQAPFFVTPLAFDFYPQFTLMNSDSAFVAGGHLQGIEFFQRGTLVDISAEEALVEWVYNEDDVTAGFSTDALALSNGNLLLFTPQDVALGDPNLNFYLTCLSPSGDVVWEVIHPSVLVNSYFQARMRVFESSTGEIQMLATVQTEAGMSFEIRHYSLDGEDLGADPVDLVTSVGWAYGIGDMHLTADDTLILVGRHSTDVSFLLALSLTGEVLFETNTTAADGGTYWNAHVSETAAGELLTAGYYANDGNLGVARRYSATGELLQEEVYGTSPDIVILRCIREMPDGRIAIGGRWSNEEDVWAPRLIILDATMENQEFSYFFPSETPGTVENLRMTDSGEIVGINDLILGAGERTDIWRLSLEPISVDGIEVGERIKIGPNPARDFIRIYDPRFDNYIICNARGAVVLAGELSKADILLNGLAAGTYTVHLAGSGLHAQTRLVKL